MSDIEDMAKTIVFLLSHLDDVKRERTFEIIFQTYCKNCGADHSHLLLSCDCENCAHE